MRIAILLLALLVAPLGLVLACTSKVPATVTVSPPLPIKSAKIFLLAHSQRDRIAKSLIDASLDVTDEWTTDSYALTVRVGNRRGARACGAVSNVAYELRGIVPNAGAQRLMVIKGRGGTGSCEPNVFDDMSRLLASYAARS
jgi:hypothetical protein